LGFALERLPVPLTPLLFIVQRLFEASACANLQVLSARGEGAAVAVEREKNINLVV
jgi:hypothetical protein